MARKLGLAIGSAITAVGVAALIWWLVATFAPAEPDGAARPGDGPAATEALELLETDPTSLLPTELQGSVDIAQAVPPGTTVDADPASWTPSTAGGGVITLTLTFQDGTTAHLAAVMVEEADGWKVLQTIPLEGAR